MYKVLLKCLIFLLLVYPLGQSKDEWVKAISNNLWTNLLKEVFNANVSF